MVTQKGGACKILFGPDPEYPAMDLNPLAALFETSGIQYEFQDDPYPAIWEKYIFIASFGMVGTAYGKSLGEVMAEPDLKAKVSGIMQEIILLARQGGISLPETIVEDSLDKAAKFPFETKTSYQRDVENSSPQNEGELFGESILRFAQTGNVSTLVTLDMYQRIQSKQ